MYIRFVFFCFISLLLSCQASAPSETDELLKLSKAYELQPNPERAVAYLNSATEYISNNKENLNLVMPVLEKASEIALSANMSSKASGYLMALIRESDDANTAKSNLIKLGSVMKSLRKSHAANIIFKGLIENYPNDTQVTPLASQMDAELASSEGYLNYLFDQVLVDPDEYGINRQNALKFVDGTEAYALVNPTRANTPEFIYKAAEVARSLRTMSKAMSLYDWLLEKYPTHEKSPTTLFIKGFLLEQEFGQEDEARKVYESFLERYPEHEMASSAKFLLGNMGKSDEEILKDIEDKKQATSAE